MSGGVAGGRKGDRPLGAMVESQRAEEGLLLTQSELELLALNHHLIASVVR